MAALVKLAGWLFGKLGVCALNGALVGALAGFLYGAVLQEHATHMPTTAELLQMVALLTITCWLVVLLIVGLWLHYGASAIAWPLLLNAFVTVLLTVWINNLVRLPDIAGLIGLLVGILVGFVLCRFCGRLPNGKSTHG